MKSTFLGAGEMAQQVTAPAALARDPGLVHSTHIVAQSLAPVPGDLTLSSGIHGH